MSPPVNIAAPAITVAPAKPSKAGGDHGKSWGGEPLTTPQHLLYRPPIAVLVSYSEIILLPAHTTAFSTLVYIVLIVCVCNWQLLTCFMGWVEAACPVLHRNPQHTKPSPAASAPLLSRHHSMPPHRSVARRAKPSCGPSKPPLLANPDPVRYRIWLDWRGS